MPGGPLSRPRAVKIALVLGTRPEIIKMAPVVWACRKAANPFFILHTGQHYDVNMDRVFFRDLGLPMPQYNLGLGGLSLREQIGRFSRAMEPIFERERPGVVLVQGDTNSVAAGAIAASRGGIPCAHHEAGLRSHDPSMPEEMNRIFTDHMARILFAPTRLSVQHLRSEGIPASRIHLTGNTIVDAVRFLERRRRGANAVAGMRGLSSLRRKRYFLVTAHRAENIDRKDRFERILEALDRLAHAYPDHDVVYPVHPRARKMCAEHGLEFPSRVRAVEPVPYIAMFRLMKNARLVITDSGGLQEECCILKVPVVTIRENTERPETIRAGVNVLVPGLEPERIVRQARAMMEKRLRWTNPFGDGRSGERIVRLLREIFGANGLRGRS